MGKHKFKDKASDKHIEMFLPEEFGNRRIQNGALWRGYKFGGNKLGLKADIHQKEDSLWGSGTEKVTHVNQCTQSFKSCTRYSD